MDDEEFVDDVAGSLEERRYYQVEHQVDVGSNAALVILMIPVIILIIVILASVTH